MFVNPIDFCVLLATLINSTSCSVNSPEYSMYTVLLYINNLSLSNDYFITLAKNPVIYPRSNDSEHPCLVSAFNCNIAKFSLLNMPFPMSF